MKLLDEDIDVERKLIHIKGAKGRKDRYMMLSDVAVDALREYQEKYKLKKWLFMGMKPGKHISTRTVPAIFEQACKKLKSRSMFLSIR